MNNRVAIIESQFMVRYDNPQNGVTVGGTQRYAHQLAVLLKDLGYRVFIVAKADKEIAFDYENIATIVTLAAKKGSLGNRVFSNKVYEYCRQKKADVVCYSDLQLAFWKCAPNSFALQHGIDWDGPNEGIKTSIRNYVYLKAACKFKRIVCVDTNYINWCRIRDKQYFSHPDKYVYIPNFADEHLFDYKYKKYTNDSFVLLYPRRLVNHRGYQIFIGMCEKLYERGYKIHPVLAFEDFAEDTLKNILKNCKCQYEIVHPKMSEICELYKEAFITFVPTRWSEGTSLSAIESLCVGCPVIVSDVGGLANIVLPNFNGDVVPADVDSFVEAAEKLLSNPDIRDQYARNCEKMIDVFGVKRWRDKMIGIIKSVDAISNTLR